MEALKENHGKIQQAIMKDIAAMVQSPEEAKALYDTINTKIGNIMTMAEETGASSTKES